MAFDALQKALTDAGKSADEKIDGYTENQRFWLNWATVWRRNFAPEELKVRLNTDPHAPANFRAIGAPSNEPSFAAAFQCKAGRRDGACRRQARRDLVIDPRLSGKFPARCGALETLACKPVRGAVTAGHRSSAHAMVVRGFFIPTTDHPMTFSIFKPAALTAAIVSALALSGCPQAGQDRRGRRAGSGLPAPRR